MRREAHHLFDEDALEIDNLAQMFHYQNLFATKIGSAAGVTST